MGALTTPRPAPAQVLVRVTSACAGCGACLLTCPEHALRPTGRAEQPLVALDGVCTGCGECIEICPVDAIEERQR